MPDNPQGKPSGQSFVDSVNQGTTPENAAQLATSIQRQWGLGPFHSLPASSWWGSDTIGALFEETTTPDGKDAVLKVQIAPTQSSEIGILATFSQYATERNLPIRPPHLYNAYDSRQRDPNSPVPFEALLLENVQGRPLLPIPQTQAETLGLSSQLDTFLSMAAQTETVPASIFPQLSQTPPAFDIAAKFSSWTQVRESRFTNHPFATGQDGQEPLSDPNLIHQAVAVLSDAYTSIPLRFQHGHMGHGDIVQATDGTYVLFSNLKWGWFVPYRDVAFHEWWYLYSCANQPNLTPQDIRKIHTEQEAAFDRFTAHLSPEERRLLLLSRLERATAALNLDVLTLEPSPTTSEAAQITKETVLTLMQELQSVNE
jgi:hypothetical protein